MSVNVESGENSLNPPMNKMHENPELRWSFIRKLYSIIIFQLLLIIAVVYVDLFVDPVANFFNSKQGTVLNIVLICVSFTTFSLPVAPYYRKHDLRSYFLLLFLNISSALPVGLTCVYIGGKKSLETVILVTIIMFILNFYTFWAAKEDHDLLLLRSFLLGSLSTIILLCFIQINLFPMDFTLTKLLLSSNLGWIISIIFCGLIVHGTQCLIKTSTYDQHIMAFVLLYYSVIITFFIPSLFLLQIIKIPYYVISKCHLLDALNN